MLRKARDNVRRKGSFEITGLPGKLADCQISKRGQSFILLRVTQEVQPNKEEIESFKLVLPLRGKILNTYVNTNGRNAGKNSENETKALSNDVIERNSNINQCFRNGLKRF